LGDFSLVVLENGSTDGTREWLAEVHDPRVTVCASQTLLPIEENWARALTVPKNEFMTFVGHDDLLEPNYLEVMDALVRRKPDAGLYFAHFRYIDGKGNTLRSCRPLPACETAAQYMAALFSFQRDTYGSGYLYRSRRYEQVGGMPRWEHLLFADDTLWMKLMDGAWKATAPEECFAVRIHPGSYGHRASWRAWARGMDRYITFLQSMAAQDPEFAKALAKHAPGYFLGWCNSLYERSLVEPCNENQRIAPQSAEFLIRLLKRIAPQRLRDFKGGPRRFRFSRRAVFNRFAVTRWFYQRYRLLRYGPDGESRKAGRRPPPRV
jgi:glycosyltransferase involved in cell wall biosynthesis